MSRTLEENETHIWIDYAGDEVHIFTTRQGVANDIRKRLGGVLDEITEIESSDSKDFTCKFIIPMKYCRDGQYITKVNK